MPDPVVTIHAGDLDASSLQNGGRWNATVTVVVHDNAEAVMSNAFVEAIWSDGANGGGSCTTDASGSCSITKQNLKNNVSSARFTVSNMTHASGSYDSSANHDPDDPADSDGSSIIVYKPGSEPPPPPPGGGTVHIGALEGNGLPGSKPNRWEAHVSITAHNNDTHSAAADATVSGSWSDGATGSDSCTTGGSGQCTVIKGNLKSNATSVTFTVTGIIDSGGASIADLGSSHDAPPANVVTTTQP
jgi:hypothetical protein